MLTRLRWGKRRGVWDRDSSEEEGGDADQQNETLQASSLCRLSSEMDWSQVALSSSVPREGREREVSTMWIRLAANKVEWRNACICGKWNAQAVREVGVDPSEPRAACSLWPCHSHLAKFLSHKLKLQHSPLHCFVAFLMCQEGDLPIWKEGGEGERILLTGKLKCIVR